MSAPLRKGWCPGALRPMEAKDGLLVRLRPTCGILPATTAQAIADLADRYGNGLFDLTARANLQMRGVHDAALPALQDGLRALGLLDVSIDAESVRNIVASPRAGLHDGPDIRPLVGALEQCLGADKPLHALPSKFGFLIDDGSRPSLASIQADVRFDWNDGRFSIGLGGASDDAIRIGSCNADMLVDEAVRIAKVFLPLSAATSDARRMRGLINSLGRQNILSAFRSTHPISAGANITFSRNRQKASARNIVGVQTFEQGLRYLGLAAPFGRLDAAMLRGVTRVAAGTSRAELRLTPWRVILIPGATQTALPGFITDAADPRLTVAACVGTAGCAHGTTDTHADATTLAAALPPGEGIALHVSGCEKGCAKASEAPLTLIAREGRYDLVRNGRAGDLPVQRGLDLAAARRAIAAELEAV